MFYADLSDYLTYIENNNTIEYFLREMASNSNNSAILDVVAINKELPLLKDTKETNPQSLYSNSNYDNSLVSISK